MEGSQSPSPGLGPGCRPERRRWKSASDLRSYYKGQHEFRRKTILCRSPLSHPQHPGHAGRKVPPQGQEQGRGDNFNKRKYSSLPHQYRCKRGPEPEPGGCLEAAAPEAVEAHELRRRLEAVRGWCQEFSDSQRTALVAAVLPFLGGAQMHFLSSRLEADLHHLCPPGCSDPLSILPLHVSYKILRLLSPQDLANVGRVCSSWRHHSLAPSLWKTLSNRSPWKLSSAGCVLQLERWAGGAPVDWRQVFVERFKLRRAWLGGQCHVRTFEGHSGGISCVQFDGTRIVSGSHDSSIKVWNVKTNSPWSVMTLVGHSGEVRCLHLEGNRLVSGSTDLSIKVWDLSMHSSWSSIACRVTMVGHTDTVRCVQMCQASDIVVSGSYDTSLKVWQLKTGACLKTLRGHTGPVLCIVAGSGQRLVSGSGDRSIRLWNLDTGFCRASLQGHGDAVTCLSVSEESSQVISGSLDRTIKVWSLVSLECQHTLDWMSSEGHTGVVRCIQADQWRILSAADDKTIKVWNLATGKRLVTLKSHTDGVTCLQFNDFYVVSGSYDKTVKLWDFTVC